MPDPETGATSGPRFPPPPRELESDALLLDLAGDGNRELLFTMPLFMLGFVSTFPLIEIFELPEVVAFVGAVLGVWVGKAINRVGLRAVLRDGIETHGEIVKIVEHVGRRPIYVYQYVVDGRASRHDVTRQGPATLEQLKIGTPVLILYDPGRIGRHLAFFPPFFTARRRLPGPQVAPELALSSTPYRDDFSGTTRRQLPVAPRSIPAGALDLFSIRRVRVVNAIFLALLLRRGIETTGTITSIEPDGEWLRIDVRYMAGNEVCTWTGMIVPNELAVAVGDTVPVLYSLHTTLRLCVPFVTHEARALVERWNAAR